MSAEILGIAIIAAVAVLIVYLMGWGLRGRATARRQMSGPLAGGDMTARAPGSATDISDGGQVRMLELFGALRIAEVPELDSEGEPNDLAGLGLKLHEGSTGYSSGQSRTRGRPQVMEGKRNGHQVFILQGTVRGFGIGFRRLRSVSCVRVDAPVFRLDAEDGSLRPSADAPGEVLGVVSDLSRSPDVWHDLRVTSGSDGIVASRGLLNDYLSGWIYDLWLLERIAAKLDAEPLDDVRLRRNWTLPYGMGSWAPSLLDGLRGAR